jgi:hypothetical protein
VRISLPRVIPLEVWDLPVDGKRLQEWRADPTFDRRLAGAARALRLAPPPSLPARTRAAASAIRHVHLVGGGVDEHVSHTMCAHGGFSTTYSHEPIAPARAGTALRPGALCADVGQTTIKLVHRKREWSVPRDLSRAPLRDSVPLEQRPLARESTLQFLASILSDSSATRIVLALPCEIRDDGLPRGCTYCWPDPDPDLVVDLERLTHRSIEILNDAELAAVAAAYHAMVPEDLTTLVLTVGFGVGGALLLPRPENLD